MVIFGSGIKPKCQRTALVHGLACYFQQVLALGLYWGTAEPLYHFAAPPEPNRTVNAAVEAMQISFLHWGATCVGSVCGGCIIFGIFSLSPRIAAGRAFGIILVIGKRIYGGWGHTVDILAVFNDVWCGDLFGVLA